MRYHGGKHQLAKQIANAILTTTKRREKYVEPFLGGAAVACQVAPRFNTTLLSDASLDLILMWQAFAEGWFPPSEISEDDYARLRYSEPSALRGLVGYFGSFGGKFFGGYARGNGRNYVDEAIRAARRQSLSLQGSTIIHGDYKDAPVQGGDVVYCDPPYAGTTEYGNVGSFDYEEFVNTVNLWSNRGAHVFVSEYAAPDSSWNSVWSKEKSTTLARHEGIPAPKVIENLYFRGAAE